MKKYKPQHKRLLFIDNRISEGNFPNCSTLAEEWEVSSKTIQRDIVEYMRYRLNAPIEYSAQDRGTPLYDRLSSVYKKIEDSLPEKQDDMELPNARFSVFSPPSTTIDPEIWDRAFNSVATGSS